MDLLDYDLIESIFLASKGGRLLLPVDSRAREGSEPVGWKEGRGHKSACIRLRQDANYANAVAHVPVAPPPAKPVLLPHTRNKQRELAAARRVGAAEGQARDDAADWDAGHVLERARRPRASRAAAAQQ